MNREGTHLVGECVHWDAECPCQTKITQLQFAFTVDQKVLWLQISVQDSVFVTEGGAFEELVHKAPYCRRVEGPAFSMGIHILF